MNKGNRLKRQPRKFHPPPLDFSKMTDDEIKEAMIKMVNEGNPRDIKRVVGLPGVMLYVMSANQNQTKKPIPWVAYPYKLYNGLLIRSLHTLNFFRKMLNSPELERLVRIYNELYPEETNVDSEERIQGQMKKYLYESGY